ncbi:hypothetical protein [Carboxylicivirga marina]|uniref:hypothetical protein n=1 Tax=Carboxylicivirga marina TaxID=2800988 RepID=UPI0025948CDB|nr:hypothetical protein [uncultured Carboxylicivirga sp.]
MNIQENEILTIFRICLESNVIKLSQIERWADNLLVNSAPVRSDYILELCFAQKGGINSTVHILKENEAQINNPLLWKVSFGLTAIYYESKEIDLGQACHCITKIANEFNYFGELKVDGMGLDDSYYLAKGGIYGEFYQVEEGLMDLTKDYKELAKDFLLETKI